jgi:hypothetical protein
MLVRAAVASLTVGSLLLIACSGAGDTSSQRDSNVTRGDGGKEKEKEKEKEKPSSPATSGGDKKPAGSAATCASTKTSHACFDCCAGGADRDPFGKSREKYTACICEAAKAFPSACAAEVCIAPGSEGGSSTEANDPCASVLEKLGEAMDRCLAVGKEACGADAACADAQKCEEESKCDDKEAETEEEDTGG